ncbi:Anion exchange protein [Plakobranchus ocellatus]|uniref:Anion exchange protein n=1 Tax=Plakobranchus ocellatus TaxID=259542 RepID=A0AAV4A8M3_9GAST|nr:Anion exchange protein [Plakobranchus ocellatus]
MEGMRSVASAISLSSNLERENSELSLDSMDEEYKKRANDRFLRKIPRGSEVANVMVAGVEDLKTTLCGLVRLNDARNLGDLSEVNLPTRFVFFLLRPAVFKEEAQESGRCLSTMLVDEVFREVAFKARNRSEIVAGIDEFLEQVTVLPPGEWDPKIRIEPPDSVPDQKFRKSPSSKALMLDGSPLPVKEVKEEHEDEGHCDPDLVFSGRLFGGLVNDVKRKIPWYWSDFKDALHVQCVASFIYIFLATLTPNVTFGGMLGKETDQILGVMECIVAAAVTGIGFALFGGQPLNILGSTGPMLVLEKIIYDFCKDNEWDFLPFRFWIGIWTSGILLVIVALDLSALVRYITRFTEESFASLIAVIFIYEAFKKLGEIADDEPLQLDPSDADMMMAPCYCRYMTATDSNGTMLMPDLGNWTIDALNRGQCESQFAQDAANAVNATIEWHCRYVPDVFMFSIILFATTFFISTFLVDFRNWSCFPTFVRNILGDFAVLIAIVLMVGLDAALGLPTPKLTVPDEFKPTNSEARDWVVDPVGGDNPWWLAIAAVLPALLSTILIFMDQQITAVIVNRKENKLKKGKGYHLDLLVLSILVSVHSLLGLPWYVAATVSAIAHVNSLKKQSECTAPGEKPAFLGVREQRVTALLVGILSGMAVLITNILKVIPMPVLYGVFLFMGWSALKGMQFVDRLLLLLMPVKYQPDHKYLRHVPLWRVHMFTCCQIMCLVALLVVKQIKAISIIFPLLVLFTGVVRKMMEWKFTPYELKYLDDLLPSKKNKKSKEEELEKQSDAKISAIIANNKFDHENTNGTKDVHFSIATPDAGKPSFFIHDEQQESPPAYDNRALDTKL